MKMRHVYLFLIAAAVFIGAAGRPVAAQTAELTDSAKLQLEVDALSSLSDLNLTPDQLSSLKDLASDTAGTLSDTPAPITEAYTKALKTMRDAILSKNEDNIDTAEEKMGELEDKQDPDSDPDVDQSSAAKTKAETFLKMLKLSQVASYIAENGDDVQDPAQMLIDAMHQCRGMSADDFQDLRDDTAQEIGVYAAGINPSKPSGMIAKVTRFLSRVHGLSDDEYSQQQSSLEDEARKMLGTMDPVNTLRHWLEDELADLLSNPQLIQAIDDWNNAAGNK
jgi:hypothetical protein